MLGSTWATSITIVSAVASFAAHLANLILQDASPTDLEAAKPSLREALFLTDPSVDRQSLIDKKGARVPGTCEWVERNETYKAWLCGDPSLLWIFGGPGKGKTMLSIYLTQQFEKLHGREAIYFFCSSEHPTRSTATAVLRTLLWQMIVIRPELTKLISPYFDPSERTQATLSTPGSLWEIFAKVIQSFELGKMQCLIDGLDECDDESSRWLTSQFTELSSQPNNSSLHIVIASRHISSTKSIKRVRLDPDNDQNVSDDIEKFASLKMKELSEQLDLTTLFCTHIQSQLLAKAGGTFLWIGYAMTELSSKRTSLEIEEAVNELPTALPALYGRMLRQIPSGKLDLIITFLHWVTLAARPLSIDELEDVVNWRVPGRMDPRQALLDYIKLCEPLVIVQQNRVLLVHQSARDYFLRDVKDDDVLAERVRTSFADAQATLAKRCLGTLGSSSSKLSAYAREHWPHHFRHCPESVQASLIDDEPFFDEGSTSRRSWWAHLRRRQVNRSLHHSISTEGPPSFHLACNLGLEVWAQKILTEVSSMNSKRALESRVRLMIKQNTFTPRQPNSVNSMHRGLTPLYYAVRGRSNHDLVVFLLRNGADPNILNWNESPLTTAVRYDTNRDTVKLLLASGADPDGGFKSNGSVRITPLRCAVQLRQEEKAISIIASGADIQAADHDRSSDGGLSVLQLAALNGLKALVRLLLEYGADPQIAQGESPIPLSLAINSNKTEVVDILLEHSASQRTFHDSCASWPLYTALIRQDLDMAQRIIRFGVVRSDFPTETLNLWAAILASNVADVTSALQGGANPNASIPSSPGCPGSLTSLHWAVVEWQHRGYNTFTLEQYGAIIRRLFEHGADYSLHDAEGKTALQRSEAKGRVWAAVASLIAKTRKGTEANEEGCNLGLLRTGGRR
jgi:ankyrin repeat protein